MYGSQASPREPRLPCAASGDLSTIIIAPDPDMRRYIASPLEQRASIREHPGTRSAMRFDGPVPAVVFLDVRGTAGPPAGAVLSLLTRFPTVAIVVLAGHADVHAAVESVRAGAFAYLLRPFSSEEIEVVWERAVQFHHYLESGRPHTAMDGATPRRNA
jgi:DNA-binding NtrC family response regulator